MPRRSTQVRRKRPIGRSSIGKVVPIELVLGPPAQEYWRSGWPERERELRELWEVHGDQAMLDSRPGDRPWGFWWFDRPHADTLPGPRRETLLVSGELSWREAEVMAECHRWADLGRVARQRAAVPDEAGADRPALGSSRDPGNGQAGADHPPVLADPGIAR